MRPSDTKVTAQFDAGVQRTARLNSLTGLRFVAALAVFARHVLPNSPIAGVGATGVSFFFILSGFVLCWSSLEVGRSALSVFYLKRLYRIYPAYLVTMVAGVLLYWHDVGFHPPAQNVAANLVLLQSWFASPHVYWSINGVAWSLSCEAFFYLLFPFVMSATGRLSVRDLYLIVVLCVFVTVGIAAFDGSTADGSGAGFWAIYILPLSRLPEFVAGVSAGHVVHRGGLRAPSRPVAIVIAAVCLGAAAVVPENFMWASVTMPAYVLLIAAYGMREQLVRKSVFASRPLVKLGEWSYAFYLLHQIIIRVAVDAFGLDENRLSAVAVFAIGATSVLCSAVLYQLIESPVERILRHRLLPHRRSGDG